MSSVNKTILIGRLGANPEVRYTQDSTAVASFNLATEEKWKDKEGNKQSKTEWIRCVAFGKLAEVCGEYLKKGSQVYVEGKLQTRSWEDKEGGKRYITEVNVGQMVMLGGGGDRKSGGDESQASPPSSEVPF